MDLGVGEGCSFRLQTLRFVVTSRSLQVAARSGAAGSRQAKALTKQQKISRNKNLAGPTYLDPGEYGS
jgi:hypothetical protein